MIPSKTTGRLVAGLCAILLASCASVPPSGEEPSRVERLRKYEERAESLQTLETWSLDGKLAVSDGEDGGSGRLEWRHQPGLSELDFRGTLGRGAWQLDIRPDHAVLNLGNGESWEAPDVSVLVRRHVGWEVPVDALGWWVRGLAAPGRLVRRDLDEAGLMTHLSQQGWDVEYRRYEEFSGVALPTRLEARNGARSVKLVMRRWTIPEASANDS